MYHPFAAKMYQLAKMAHTLDKVSNGRLILGVGSGWHKPEYDAYGYTFDRRVNRLEETLQIRSLSALERVAEAARLYRSETQ